MGIPDSADIASVIEDIETATWLKPLGYEDRCWLCELYDCSGKRVADGIGLTAREAAAYAWIACWDPDALIFNCVTALDMPAEPDDRWRFELSPGHVALSCRDCAFVEQPIDFAQLLLNGTIDGPSKARLWAWIRCDRSCPARAGPLRNWRDLRC